MIREQNTSAGPWKSVEKSIRVVGFGARFVRVSALRVYNLQRILDMAEHGRGL